MVIFGFVEFQASLGNILRKKKRDEEEGEKQEEERVKEEEENFQQAALALVWSRASQGEQGGQAEAVPRGFAHHVGTLASIPSAAGPTGRI